MKGHAGMDLQSRVVCGRAYKGSPWLAGTVQESSMSSLEANGSTVCGNSSAVLEILLQAMTMFLHRRLLGRAAPLAPPWRCWGGLFLEIRTMGTGMKIHRTAGGIVIKNADHHFGARCASLS